MPNIALLMMKPMIGIRNSSIGRVKYFGQPTMPIVQMIAIIVKTRCRASANHENQPVRKWNFWPRLSGLSLRVIQPKRAFMICIAPKAQR